MAFGYSESMIVQPTTYTVVISVKGWADQDMANGYAEVLQEKLSKGLPVSLSVEAVVRVHEA